MKVVFSDRAYAAIMSETTEKITTETGGLFLGTVYGNIWYVVEVIDPGPNSIFEVDYFEYDQKYTQHLINKIANLYEEKLELIGLWHRHPLSLDVFSKTDNVTNAKYARMRKYGAISGLVNIDPKFRLTMYHVAQPCVYSKIPYVVGDELIPEKYLKLKPKHHFEQLMQNNLNNVSLPKNERTITSLQSFMDCIYPYFSDLCLKTDADSRIALTEDASKDLIDIVVSDIDFMTDELGIEMSVMQKNGLFAMLQDTQEGITKIYIFYDENSERYVFQYEDQFCTYEEGLFEELYKTYRRNHQNSFSNKTIFHLGQENVENIKPGTEPLLDGVKKIVRFNRRGNN